MKVLVLGRSLAGAQLITRINAINTKYGPFDACFCTIEEWDLGLTAENAHLPVPTYFIAGSKDFPETIESHLETSDNQYGRNLFYLGKHGVYTTADGLRIAFIGSADSASPASENNRVFYPSDVGELLEHKEKSGSPLAVDLLLSYEWSAGIMSDHQHLSGDGSKSIASLALKFQPRYHFTSKCEYFVERAPYRNIGSLYPTRFINLAPVGNQQKERWFYAMNITPTSVEAASASNISVNAAVGNITDNPLLGSVAGKQQKRPPSSAEDGFFFASADTKRARTGPTSRQPPEGYVCKICSQPGHYIQDCPNKPPPTIPEGYICNICHEPGHLIRDCPKKPTASSQPPEGYICKICKKSGHYIRDCPERSERPPSSVTVRGMAMESGAGGCWFCLSNPKLEKHLIVSIGDEIYLSLPKGELVTDHLLLLSVEHIPNSLALQTEGSKQELQRYKEALRNYFAQQQMDMVWFETNLKSQHMSIQIVPIPKEKSPTLEEYIQQAAEKLEAAFEGTDAVQLDSRSPFYRFELPSGKQIAYQPKGRFSVQFGRQLLADFLNIKERADWKQCVKSESDESRDAERFKFMFKQFDFTLTE